MSREPSLPPRARILVVEDETLLARAIGRRLEKAGFAVVLAGTLREASQHCLTQLPDLLLLDMRLPDGSGLEFLQRLRAEPGGSAAVIAMSAYGEIEDAVSAMKLGAADYLRKPVDLEELLLNVDKVLAQQQLSRQLEYSRVREATTQDLPELVGDSPAAQRLRDQIQRIAALAGSGEAAPTVLIAGETGTGKDVTARLLHQASRRSARPFVQVDCASLPKDLVEAELFGHVKGAFTSAAGERTGLIEAAEDGVVFLDEIAELPLDLQAKLLAVLERRSLRRVGSSQERKVHAWFIAATNRDVQAMVAGGTFRADLFYRLNVLTLQLPPLRDRAGDVLLLARHFMHEIARRYGLPGVELEAGAEAVLMAYAWPGNVRELRHVMERALLLAGGGPIAAEALMLPGASAMQAGSGAGLDGLTLEAAEKVLLEQALQRAGNNVSEAARLLGITRMTMRYRMRQHGLGQA